MTTKQANPVKVNKRPSVTVNEKQPVKTKAPQPNGYETALEQFRRYSPGEKKLGPVYSTCPRSRVVIAMIYAAKALDRGERQPADVHEVRIRLLGLVPPHSFIRPLIERVLK